MAKEEKQETTQINLRIKDGEQFYANESSINFNPSDISLDFKCVTHTHDLANRRGILLRHNVVILAPFHAKNFVAMLNKAIKDYEEKFGEIKKPEHLKRAEKIVKKEQKKREENKQESSGTYFG